MKADIRFPIETGTPVVCPFRHADRRLCLASSSGLIPDLKRRLKYCLTDDFDSCPLFLCRCLRSSPAKNYSHHIRTSES